MSKSVVVRGGGKVLAVSRWLVCCCLVTRVLARVLALELEMAKAPGC